jgi:hypothetical protein
MSTSRLYGDSLVVVGAQLENLRAESFPQSPGSRWDRSSKKKKKRRIPRAVHALHRGTVIARPRRTSVLGRARAPRAIGASGPAHYFRERR